MFTEQSSPDRNFMVRTALVSAGQAIRINDWTYVTKKLLEVKSIYSEQPPANIYVLLSMAYRFQHLLDWAENIINEGKEKYPQHADILMEHAEVGKAQKDLISTDRYNKTLKQKSQKNTSQYRSAQHQIEKISKKLFELGFADRASGELKHIATGNYQNIVKTLAAWELASWYAGQLSRSNAQKCLDMLAVVEKSGADPAKFASASIIKAECLSLLGKDHEAKKFLQHALSQEPRTDLYMAAANLEPKLPDKLAWINKALRLHGLSEVSSTPDTGNNNAPASKRLRACSAAKLKAEQAHSSPLVSVIIPAHHNLHHINIALESLLKQTWENMEILVVGAGGQDDLEQKLSENIRQDSRLKIIWTNENAGKYLALNTALKKASGEFVTCHEPQEWSHPQRIETQVVSLINYPNSVGNIAQTTIIDADFKFVLQTNPGGYLTDNLSSFMFRREPVFNAVGYWDCVLYGADREYMQRIKNVFGGSSIFSTNSGILSFMNKTIDPHESQIKRNFTYFSGAISEYLESSNYHQSNTNCNHYEFPQNKRPFPAPHCLLPNTEDKLNDCRHFDVIIASEFRVPGGNNYSNLEEIKAQKLMGLKTGLIQISRYDLNYDHKKFPEFREYIDGEKVQVITCEERVSCDLLILRYPPVLQDLQKSIPNVQAKQVKIMANVPPLHYYGQKGLLRYKIESCHQNLLKYFNNPGTWHPIGPLVRKALTDYHADDLTYINLSKKDWVNIINVSEWKRASRPETGTNIRIGRHSRDHETKWPADKNELLSIYPDSDRHEVHILGGANTPKRILGYKPKNWIVHDYGSMHPQAFLSKLDVYIYYTNPNWVEAFGRVIIEAMAVGVPVILPHEYKSLFGDVAIYAHPSEVAARIDELMQDSDYYDRKVQRALEYVEENFGYSQHAKRLKEINPGFNIDFPGHYEPVQPDDETVAHALEAIQQENWAEAIRRWQKVFLKHKNQAPAHAYASLSLAHRMQGNPDKAEKLIEQGQKNYPDDKELLLEYVKTAKARRDRAEAAKRSQRLEQVSNRQEGLDHSSGTTYYQQAITSPIDNQHADPSTSQKMFSAKQRQGQSIGRNAKCPCGSGKKVKKCCGIESETKTQINKDDCSNHHASKLNNKENYNWCKPLQNYKSASVATDSEPLELDGKLKHIYFVYPDTKDAHGMHYNSSLKRVHKTKSAGIDAEAVALESPDFLRAITDCSNHEGYVLFAGRNGYDLTINSRKLNKNVFDHLNVNVIATLADHPYSSFMWRLLDNAAENTVFFTRPSLDRELRAIYPQLTRTDVYESLGGPHNQNIDQALAQRPLSKRHIDLLIPLGLHKFFKKPSLKQQLHQLGQEAQKIGESLFEAARKDYHTTVFENFQNIIKHEFGEEHVFSHPKTKQDWIWLNVLSVVDWTVRMDRRVRLLNSLHRLPSSTRINITASPKVADFFPRLKNKKNIHWIGEVSTKKLEDLYSESKMVLNCNPTYPDFVNERVRNAMAWGCCVISDYQQALGKHFQDHVSILFTDPEGRKIEDFCELNVNVLQDIADAGRNLMPAPQPDKGNIGFLKRIEKHLPDIKLNDPGQLSKDPDKSADPEAKALRSCFSSQSNSQKPASSKNNNLKLLMAGNQEVIENDQMTVDWILTRRCNYSCSYCTVYNNKTGFFVPIENLNSVIDRLNDLPHQKIKLALSGGEPTIHPRYLDFIEHTISTLQDRVTINTQTNFSRQLKFYENLVDRIGEQTDKISFSSSYHFEHAEKHRFIENILFLTEKKVPVTFKICAEPDRMDQVKDLYNEAKYLENDFLKVALVVVRENYGSFPDKRYSSEDLAWLQNEYTENKGTILLKYYDISCNRIRDYYHTADELIINGMHKFTGMSCYAGLNRISIGSDGSLAPSVCLRWSKGLKHNVYDNPSSILSFQEPITCPCKVCHVPADMQVPKYNFGLINKISKHNNQHLFSFC
ncbi:glycosyl transferase family 2 [Desulfonatronospira thiodismutans ASO3-1]|uniref:Glycosyl transferase family 2 n=1 Tax=Desulfonatronospira thiodismutans ASO3-1 TaxID=555779 RepID=D6SU54_9BACT|nr:glycosyltransferase [Desulfonatronospira thiodismutans]EFI32834.1 glycosyl transferase family 2 [Desulfonatronospira thiodismutans ASO3-1]